MRSAMRKSPTPMALRAEPDMPGVWSMFSTNHPMRANHHPTVKPIALMRDMIRLVATRGAVGLEPFMGAGSTGGAAMVEGMPFVGIEITPEYVDIARRRIAWWSSSSPLDNMATMELHEENEA